MAVQCWSYTQLDFYFNIKTLFKLNSVMKILSRKLHCDEENILSLKYRCSVPCPPRYFTIMFTICFRRVESEPLLTFYFKMKHCSDSIINVTTLRQRGNFCSFIMLCNVFKFTYFTVIFLNVSQISANYRPAGIFEWIDCSHVNIHKGCSSDEMYASSEAAWLAWTERESQRQNSDVITVKPHLRDVCSRCISVKVLQLKTNTQ